MNWNVPVTMLEAIASGPNKLQFQLVHPNANPPLKGTAGSNAFDLYAAQSQEVDQSSAVQYQYDTGVAVAIPDGFVGLVFPRSSICKTDLRLSNSVGVIDSDYRGTIKAVFDGVGTHEDARYDIGERICQLLIVPSPVFELEQVDTLPSTERGSDGFGSTGNR